MGKHRAEPKVSAEAAAYIQENKSYEAIKRVIDFFGSCFGIILLSVVFLIIALVIKMEDPADPIFFKQKRIGKNGKEFEIYKFRTMVPDAEKLLADLLVQNEVTGLMFKMKQDPRITRTGRFLRKTSLDELPQLWNVVKGNMSLVGPRPPVPREVKEYTSYDRQRLTVMPGCTGLWQVSGRSNTSFKEMVELDMEYIRRRSTLFDLKILFKTIPLFTGSNNAF